MLSSIAADVRTDLAGSSSTTSKSAEPASGGFSFSDILVSTTGGAPDGRASEQATAAAAGAAENDVDILSKLSGAFRNGAPDGTLGVATIDRYGNVVAGASLDADGNLSVFGSGSSGGASSEIGMSLSAQGGGSWYANASSELAQATYELNALITQSTAAAGVDRAA
jgi:hypothetical protein